MFLDITEQEYRGLGCPSYSLLAGIDKEGIRSIFKKHKPTTSMAIGSMVDCGLFEPQFLKDRFSTSKNKPISGLLKELLESLYELTNFKEIVQERDSNVVLEVMNKLGMYKNIKNPDKRVAIFNTESFWEEANNMIGDKILMHPDEFKLASKIIGIMRNHDNSKYFFEEHDGIEILFQKKLKFKLRNYTLKSMYDIIVIDHNTKTIKPFDLKVTSSTQDEFALNYRKFRYNIQAAVYSSGLKYMIENDLDYLGYTLDEFKFLVYSIPDEFPFIWAVPKENIPYYIDGLVDKKSGVQVIRGVISLLEEYYDFIMYGRNKTPYKYRGVKQKYIRRITE